MKRIAASIGVLAIGSTAIQQADAVSLSSQERTKPWSVGVALRGFYDDNYLLAARDTPRVHESFGVEIRPTVSLNLPLEQTYIGFDFTYAGQWYEDDSHWDHTFIVEGMLNQAFSERVNLDVGDRFVYSDRPELTDPTLPAPDRNDQSAYNNTADVTLAFGLSPRLGLLAQYQNDWWDYDQEGTVNSLSALLDRIINKPTIQLRHQTAPATTTSLGFTYRDVTRTSDDLISNGGPQPVDAEVRNNRGYIGFLGVEHVFNPLFSAGAQAGVEYTDFYNDPINDGQVTPWGNLTLTYFYAQGSSVTAGYNLSQAATDLVGDYNVNQSFTQNRTSSSLFARVNHEFYPDFHGSLFGQWILSDYNGGAYDGATENLYLAGASLRYDINPFLSAELGYTFDYLSSDPVLEQTAAGTVPRGYTRNRVYIGLKATY